LEIKILYGREFFSWNSPFNSVGKNLNGGENLVADCEKGGHGAKLQCRLSANGVIEL
jgi:hypothetical protein